MVQSHRQYNSGHMNKYSDRILVGNWNEERTWPSIVPTAAHKFEGASTSNSTYGVQSILQQPTYRRKDWDKVYHCSGKETILAPSPLPLTFTPSYHATVQQLSYGLSALISTKKRVWQEEAAMDVWDTSSHIASRTGACLQGAPCKRQCCRPCDQLGEPPQPGQKAMGALVQQFDATWRKIGLRGAQKGKTEAKAAAVVAPA